MGNFYPMQMVAVALLAVLVFISIEATLVIRRDDLLERRQRLFQVLLVWLLPIIGALLVLAIQRQTEEPSALCKEEADEPDDDIYDDDYDPTSIATSSVDGSGDSD